MTRRVTIEELHLGWTARGTMVHVVPPADWAPSGNSRQSLNERHNAWVRERHPRHTTPMCGSAVSFGNSGHTMPMTAWLDGDLTPFMEWLEREWCGPCVGRLMKALGLDNDAMELVRGQRRMLTPRS